MNTRLSKGLAAALLAVVLSLNVAPSAYAATRDGGDPVRDRIVRFFNSIRNIFLPGSLSDNASPPRG